MNWYYWMPSLEIGIHEINIYLKTWKLFDLVIDPRKCVSFYAISSLRFDQSYELVETLEVIYPILEVTVAKIDKCIMRNHVT